MTEPFGNKTEKGDELVDDFLIVPNFDNLLLLDIQDISHSKFVGDTTWQSQNGLLLA